MGEFLGYNDNQNFILKIDTKAKIEILFSEMMNI